MKTLRRFSITLCFIVVVFWVGMMLGRTPALSATVASAATTSRSAGGETGSDATDNARSADILTPHRVWYLVGKRYWGRASYYGGPDRLFWKPRSDGTPYNPADCFVASEQFPRNTLLWVVNPANGRGLYLPVRDFGPRSDLGRALDLSSCAADYLGTKRIGVAILYYQQVEARTVYR